MPEQPVWMTPDPWEVELDRLKERTKAQRAEHRREYKRLWQRMYRARRRAAVTGWLHELKCDGNHKGNYTCKPIPTYGEPQEEAA